MQEIIVYIAVLLSVFFLIKKFYFKKRSTKCNKDCDCWFFSR